MPLKRTHIVANDSKTKGSAVAHVATKSFVGVVQPKSKTKRSGTDVAKKSFAGMITQKSEIASALRNGNQLSDIKGIRFVKPF